MTMHRFSSRSDLFSTAHHWASLLPEACLEALGSQAEGLSASEAHARLVRFGPNATPRIPPPPWHRELARAFGNFFALLLWLASALAWVAGMPQLTIAILIVVVVNGTFSFWQEYRAERAAEALEALLPRRARVRREGEIRDVANTEVVPGDILILCAGDQVPADARLLRAQELRLDLSTLTGESRPAPRTAAPVSRSGEPAISLPNLVFAGTLVVGGTGEAVVFATGEATEFGRLAALAQRQPEAQSPLQRELVRVTRAVSMVAVALGAASFFAAEAVGQFSAADAFVFALGMIVANVPEGLLPTLSLALAAAVRIMARQNALVKRLSTVEALGAATVILTDKTGTLTQNQMRVREAWMGQVRAVLQGAAYEPTGSVAYEPRGDPSAPALTTRLLRAAALCCNARLEYDPTKGRWLARGDATEAAILAAAGKAGLTAERLAQWPRLAELPFDSVRKRMTTVHQDGTRAVACTKGALSEVLALCSRVGVPAGETPLGVERKRAILEAHRALAEQGLRVLAVAEKDLGSASDAAWEQGAHDVEQELTFLGLLALEDPPRPEVPAAIAACRQAGIRVCMVTGDDSHTALAIGKTIGLYGEDALVVCGPELDAIHAARLDQLLRRDAVLFARTTPEHKLHLVEAFQRRGEVVAVTGDGVNDAPALRRAEIGVAMGASGTDVAREAADMILLDDNFATIVAAIREGRAVFENVRKFINYILASNIPEIVPFVLFVIFAIPLPLTVMQILAVDLGTDLFPALALGREPAEPEVMQRPPRTRRERLLDWRTLLRAYAWLGPIQAALSMAAFFWTYWLYGWRFGESLNAYEAAYPQATTATFAAIVACQVGNAFACRSERTSTFALGFTSNRPLLLAIGIELALLFILIHWPPLGWVFDFAPLEPQQWALIASFPLVFLLVEESRKFVMRAFWPDNTASRVRRGSFDTATD